ncbi:MAG: Anti-sigma factor antagonist [Vampirovibrio sp.]|jgi:anti-sigma B factor antagonist|nr:Anti-sigma factor antagonist [Vampirovibrio sp.]
MELENRFLPDCVVVDISDDKFGYPKTLVLKSHVTRLLAEGHRHVVLNLGQVEMLDSFGLAVLISLLKLCKEHRGNLTLYGLNQQVTRLIELTHMDRVLDIWETEGQAVSQVKAV